MKITRISPYTGKENIMELDITPEQWAVWNSPNRPLIQNAFPNLNPSEREFILTGYTREDWDALFPPEDEE